MVHWSTLAQGALEGLRVLGLMVTLDLKKNHDSICGCLLVSLVGWNAFQLVGSSVCSLLAAAFLSL